MHVIAVVAQKGGVGKTTVSQCLAVEALRQGMAAAIIDTDPQKSTAEWGSQREAGQIDAPSMMPITSQIRRLRLRRQRPELRTRVMACRDRTDTSEGA